MDHQRRPPVAVDGIQRRAVGQQRICARELPPRPRVVRPDADGVQSGQPHKLKSMAPMSAFLSRRRLTILSYSRSPPR